MALDIEQELRILLASAPQNLHSIQTLEISHSALSRVFYLWAEPFVGTISTETSTVTVQPINMEIKLAGSSNNLDQQFNILLDLTDINDEFRVELDSVPLDTTEKIKITYREYISNDLTEIMASSVLQVESITYTIGSAAISAVQPRLSLSRTGELYTPRDIPMLRGFL